MKDNSYQSLQVTQLYFFEYTFDPITSADRDHSFNVLTDHEDCNCNPKPPSAHHFHHSAVHHRPWPRWIAETDDEVDDDDEVGNCDEMGNKMDNNDKVDDGNELDDDDESDDEDHFDGSQPPRKHAKHNSTCHDAKPT